MPRRRTTANKPRTSIHFTTVLGNELNVSVTAEDRHILYGVITRPDVPQGYMGHAQLASVKSRLSRGENPARLIQTMQSEFEIKFARKNGPLNVEIHSLPITPEMRATGYAQR